MHLVRPVKTLDPFSSMGESTVPRFDQYLGMLGRRCEGFESAGNAFNSDFTRDQRVAIDPAVCQMLKRTPELVARIPKNKLDTQLLIGPHHRLNLVPFHADPDHHQSSIGG